MKFSLLLVALLACGTAQAADWVQITKSGNEVVFVDRSRIKINGNIRQAWFKSNYAPHTFKFGGGTKYVSSFISLTSFNCNEQTYDLLSAVAYYEDGTNQAGAGVAAPVVPDSVGEAQMNYLCNLKQ
jgi:hypothetical protein